MTMIIEASREAQSPISVRRGPRAAVRDGRRSGVAPNGQAYDTRFVAATERLATDGGVILLSAWRFEEYLKRPVFVDQHDVTSDKPLTAKAIGQTVCIQVEGDLPVELVGPSGRALVAYVKFANTIYGQEVKGLYTDGTLNDVSVRWDPLTTQIRAPYADEAALNPGVQWICDLANLVEISAVLFGADPGAQQIRSNPVASAVALAARAVRRAWTVRGTSATIALESKAVTNTAASGTSTIGNDEDEDFGYPKAPLKDRDPASGDACGRCGHRCCDVCQGEDCAGVCCPTCAAFAVADLVDFDAIEREWLRDQVGVRVQ